MPSEAMQNVSRGDRDAMGQDEDGWAMHRRVDVVLDGTHARAQCRDGVEWR